MSLEWLQIGNFRCIDELQIEPHPACNIITGGNASGKTSFLEAIFYLGRGRSFRTAYREHLIQDGSGSFSVVGRVVGDHTVTLGISADRAGSQARVDGEKAGSLADLAAALPIQIIDPEIHKLVEEGPARRRRFVDWGVFHVKHEFLDQWRRYQRALRQRNAGLRKNQPRRALLGFEMELIEAGTAVSQFREAYISALKVVIDPIVSDLLQLSVDLRYSPGWPDRLDLQQALDESWTRDCRQQATHPGPHRADLHIRVSGKGAKNRVSRGQQKLLAASLILAQCEHLQTELSAVSKNPGVLLVDDPGAELDQDRLEGLLNRVESSRAQLFVTALDDSALPVKKEAKRFHVELGKMTEMVY